MSRKAIFTVSTPVPQAHTVTLDSGSWKYHILPGHSEMKGRVANIKAAVQSPTLVCTATDPSYIGFVSHVERDETGKPMLVIIDPKSGHNSRVVTAYYAAKYDNVESLNVIWTP